MDNYIKEFENMSLCDIADELVEPLFTIEQDLARTIYIHYAEERDKNYELQQQLKKKDEVISKAIKVIRECKMLFPHEFDWEEQIDNLLQILEDKEVEK